VKDADFGEVPRVVADGDLLPPRTRPGSPPGTAARGSGSRRGVGRLRPPVEFRLVSETSQSFPSGHALASVAVMGALAVVFLPPIADRRP